MGKSHNFCCYLPIVFVCAVFLLSSKALNIKDRRHCCTLGTNYSSNGLDCKTFQPPIAGIQMEDETVCLSVLEVCCKKQLRIIQCELGKSDARTGTCHWEDTERKECCDACLLGIESKKANEPCIDGFGLGPPYDDAFTHCCEEPEYGITNFSIASTTPKPNSKPHLPGLSDENVCETREFCAQLCEPTAKSYKCACFEGFTLMDDGVSCKRVKNKSGTGRCETDNPCDHECVDTGTAITCHCREGYELAADKRTCKDIDECALNLHDCLDYEETCVNEDGTYACYFNDNTNNYDDKCPIGYRFDSKKHVCDDVNECEFDLICQPPKVCKNSIGSYICEGNEDTILQCPPGFHYKASIASCADTDECITGENDCNKESQVCLNTKGNYTCVDKARNICPPGFKKSEITFLCEDINECEEGVQLCGKDEQCVNEQGGHTCVKLNTTSVANYSTSTLPTKLFVKCPAGYKFDVDATECQDVDECASYPRPCTDNQRCINVPGSYDCDCFKGFIKHRKVCVDINECQLGTHHCSIAERCDNTIGSYVCARILGCGTGYTFNSATGLCEDDDECFLGLDNCDELGPNFKCRNLLGSYRCEIVRPTRAFLTPRTTTTVRSMTTSRSTTTETPSTTKVLVTNTTTLASIPTSSTTVRDASSTTEYVQNIFTTESSSYRPPYSLNPRLTFPALYTTQKYPIINGRFKQCLPGYLMNEFGDCVDIDECLSNPCPRNHKCLNFNGKYECSPPMQCKIGYELNEDGDVCIDVNECTRGTHKCNGSQICKNGLGYYTCECPPGHHLSRGTQMCEDIDECRFYRPCGNNAECINTRGSFLCQCKSGFRRNNNSVCEDINECNETPDLCEHNCVNIYGSYRCACKPGFTLNYDNRTCTDIDECERFKDRKLCIGTCRNVPGSYDCECPPGYKLGSDGRICLDIDECEQNICGSENVCLNTRGSYKCYTINCPPNYMKDSDHKSRCKRLQSTCDARDYQCILMPEQYTYQYMTLVSNLPLSDGHIQLFQIKGPQWRATRAEFSLSLKEVNCPYNVEKVTDQHFQKLNHQFNSMQLFLVRSIEGPQEIKLQVEMRLYQGNTLIGNVVVYIIIVVSEYEF